MKSYDIRDIEKQTGLNVNFIRRCLAEMKDVFEPGSSSFIPGLIVVIPAVIAMRGNISTALGSRLGSAYHLGIIDANNLFNEELNRKLSRGDTS